MSLKAAINHEDSARIDVALPITIESIFMIPEELRAVFCQRCGLIAAQRADSVQNLSSFLHSPINQMTLAQINASLAHDEQEIRTRGEPELWEIAAEVFGVDVRMSMVRA